MYALPASSRRTCNVDAVAPLDLPVSADSATAHDIARITIRRRQGQSSGFYPPQARVAPTIAPVAPEGALKPPRCCVPSAALPRTHKVLECSPSCTDAATGADPDARPCIDTTPQCSGSSIPAPLSFRCQVVPLLRICQASPAALAPVEAPRSRTDASRRPRQRSCRVASARALRSTAAPGTQATPGSTPRSSAERSWSSNLASPATRGATRQVWAQRCGRHGACGEGRHRCIPQSSSTTAPPQRHPSFCIGHPAIPLGRPGGSLLPFGNLCLGTRRAEMAETRCPRRTGGPGAEWRPGPIAAGWSCTRLHLRCGFPRSSSKATTKQWMKSL